MDHGGYESIWLSLHRTPHQLRYISAHGVDTRVLECGRRDAPPLVLLHGTAGSLENFCRNYAPLGAHYRVIGIDMLGCGHTAKPSYDCTTEEYVEHVHETLQALGVESALFIGVSFGSWVSAALERAHPGTVRKLIMVAPAGIVVDEHDYQKQLAAIRARRTQAAAKPSWDAIKGILGRLVKHPDDLIDDLIAVRLDIYSQPAMQEAMPRVLAFMEDRPLTHDQWRSLQIPILVVVNVDTPNMFVDNGRAIARTAPNATSIDFKDVDHWAQYERSDDFNRIAVAYFAGEKVPGVV
jgi:pimeloyl-ACP methyl ester carboxylesterase